MPSDVETFLYRADRLPGRFKVWRHGPAALPALLRAHAYSTMQSLHWLETNAPNSILDDAGAHLLIAERVIQASDVAARLYSWAGRWSEDRAVIDLSWDHPDVTRALGQAKRLAYLQKLAFGVKGGRYHVSKRAGDHYEIRIDRRFVEGACHGEQLVFDAYEAEPSNIELSNATMGYLRRTSRLSPLAVLDSIPDELALKMLVNQRTRCVPRFVDGNIDLGGVTLEQALELYARLLTVAAFAERVASVRKVPETVILTPTRDILIASLATSVPGDNGPVITREQATAFVSLLSAPVMSDADPRITPLLPWHNWILVDPLALVGAPEVQILRALSREPARFGRVGTAMGKRDEEWVRRWVQVPGVDVRKRVKVRRPDGSMAGDLDIVAVDRVARRGLIMEVKSPLPNVRDVDLASTDSLLRKAASQASALAAKLSASEVAALFPPDWPPYDTVEWTWLIGHPGEFDPGGEEYGFNLPVVSPLVFDSLGPYRTLADALGRLVSRPLTEGHDYVVAERQLRIGNMRVDFDVVRVYHGAARGSSIVPPSPLNGI